MSSTRTVRRAVIPAAGLGTRLFPASHAVKKELFPIVGPDGVARALIHYHLLELHRAGINEVCIIVQPGDEAVFRQYFEGPDETYFGRLAKYPALQDEARLMRELAKGLHFAVQEKQEGFGHAVYQTKTFANGEPVLLGLGDHLFQGAPLSPYAELATAFAHTGGKSLSAVNSITVADLKGYGTIAGSRRSDNPLLIDVELIVEKPTPEVARAQLRVNDTPADVFLGWFGMHVLAPSIYDVLGQMITDNTRDNGEFQLTRAQEIQRQQEGYCALQMTSARRFDFGTPMEYVESLAAFCGRKVV